MGDVRVHQPLYAAVHDRDAHAASRVAERVHGVGADRGDTLGQQVVDPTIQVDALDARQQPSRRDHGRRRGGAEDRQMREADDSGADAGERIGDRADLGDRADVDDDLHQVARAGFAEGVVERLVERRPAQQGADAEDHRSRGSDGVAGRRSSRQPASRGARSVKAAAHGKRMGASFEESRVRQAAAKTRPARSRPPARSLGA